MSKPKEREEEEAPIACPWCASPMTHIIGKPEWGGFAVYCQKCKKTYFVEDAEGKITFKE